MRHRFSLTTLFVVVAIAALWMAPFRWLIEHGRTDSLGRLFQGSLEMMAFCGCAGFCLGFASGVWHSRGWASILLRTVGGASIGAAAGIQLCLRIGWVTVAAIPLMLIAFSMLIALRQWLAVPPAHTRQTPLGTKRVV